MMDISDERLGDLWRMPDHYMRPISFARAVLALQEREDVVPLSEAVTDEMALAFHRAISDGSIGQGELEEIKTGLRAALGGR